MSSRNMQQGQQISSFTEFALEQRIVSVNRSRAGSASPAKRVSQMSSRRREFVIHKISSFCESHDLEALIDELLSIHGAMALQEQSLRNAYEKASLEVFFEGVLKRIIMLLVRNGRRKSNFTSSRLSSQLSSKAALSMTRYLKIYLYLSE